MLEFLNDIESVTVTIGGHDFKIRSIGALEFIEVIEDCRRWARATTSKDLQGEEPSPMKVQLLQSALSANQGIANLIGEVDYTDAYSVAVAYAVVVSSTAFQCIRSLMTADGKDLAATYEDRAKFVQSVIRNPKALEEINAALKAASEAGDTPNDLPAV